VANGGKGKKIVERSRNRKVASGISYPPQYYDYAQEGFFGEEKNRTMGYPDDMDKIPFRNSAIKRLKGKSIKK
tara:strand:+ start:1075 stop:1293 length:219 start_codon:yes stop_codon:yes gene_type:complete